jgi:hypothetical protein
MSDFNASVEYEALRAEILATQRRDFQVIGAGALIIPAIGYLNQDMAKGVVLGLPLVVVSVVLMHLGNTHSITRIGRYIREEIEANEKPCGWETWLQNEDQASVAERAQLSETRSGASRLRRWWRRLRPEVAFRTDRRTAEQYMKHSVSILFGVYYTATTSLAISYAAHWGVTAVITAYVLYTGIFGWLTIHLFRHLPISTSAEEAAQKRVTKFKPASIAVKTADPTPATGKYVVPGHPESPPPESPHAE